MSLFVERLLLQNFRNYTYQEFNDFSGINILVGENARGKTNFIEGLQLVTALASFRKATTEQLIAYQQKAAHLEVRALSDTRRLDIGLTLENKRRYYTLNGKSKKPLELQGLLPAVTFTPDDLSLIKGSNSGRRNALDLLGCQVNKNYAQVKRDYEKVIKHKNKLLKEEADQDIVDAINEMVVTVGTQLTYFRVNLFNRLKPYIIEKYQEIADSRELLDVEYRIPTSADLLITKQDIRQNIEENLVLVKEKERERGVSLCGPHTHEIIFTLNGNNATLFGSQGQQRSIVLAFKIAETLIIDEILQQKPLLLLDDVMSELDTKRRKALMESINHGSQTFITTAHIDYFTPDMLELSKVISLNNQ
jgi:DNA replication and repair protein RecF